MKFKKFTNYESDFVPEQISPDTIVDSTCSVPQAVRIQNLLAAGESLINLMPKSGEYEQHGEVNEQLLDSLSDYADLAEVDSFLKHQASKAMSDYEKAAENSAESVALKSEPVIGSDGAGSGAAGAASEAPAAKGV